MVKRHGAVLRLGASIKEKVKKKYILTRTLDITGHTPHVLHVRVMSQAGSSYLWDVIATSGLED